MSTMCSTNEPSVDEVNSSPVHVERIGAEMSANCGNWMLRRATSSKTWFLAPSACIGEW